MASLSRLTVDHDEIRDWAEARGGIPAAVAGTRSGENAVLRLDFGDSDEQLEQISWDEFFRVFDDNGLAFLYQDEKENGEVSRFSRFVVREEGEEAFYEEDAGVLPDDE